MTAFGGWPGDTDDVEIRPGPGVPSGAGNPPAARAADKGTSRSRGPGPVASINDDRIDLSGVKPLTFGEGLILSGVAGAALGLVYLALTGRLF